MKAFRPQVRLNIGAQNGKIGPIPVVSIERKSCPKSCPFRTSSGAQWILGACYAEQHLYMNKDWTLLDKKERGHDWPELLNRLRRLPRGQLWRWADKGDIALPVAGENSNRVNRGALRELTEANKGRRGFGYTHLPDSEANIAAIKEAAAGGFVLNLSGNHLAHADRLSRHGLPVVVTVPENTPDSPLRTPEGRPVVICPAQTEKGEARGMNCAQCGLCANGDRKTIVAFKAHGSGKGQLNKLISAASLTRKAVTA